jgi:hypothetical protein
MYILEIFDCFQFHNEALSHQEIQAMQSDFNSSIEHGNKELPLVFDAASLKLKAERILIHQFQKTGSKVTVNSDCRSDNFLGLVLRAPASCWLQLPISFPVG